MTIGIIGRKRGMTRLFTEDGQSVPVTVIEASPNRVASLTDPARNGYRAVQVAWGEKRKNLINKPKAGELSKVAIETAEGLTEFRLEEGEGEDLAPGSEIKVDLFENGQIVDVTGTSIGKGYGGVIKRHNFSHQRNSHGNSISHRAPGSIGQCQTPGRVFKGKKMAGHMGNVRRTCQNLEVVRVDLERNLLLVKGAVPGSKGGKVIVKPAVKGRS
ncbi:MAG: 50S ribosomal protein L3 [Gammaproteobacteria bacterium]|jgi:large subunit ribosomal protein L3|nr:50S ribosomal protein L3 [Gammaproteobacteria bacterium]